MLFSGQQHSTQCCIEYGFWCRAWRQDRCLGNPGNSAYKSQVSRLQLLHKLPTNEERQFSELVKCPALNLDSLVLAPRVR